MCGIAAFFGPNAPEVVYRLLVELQHRGQESAGIALLGAESIRCFRGRGLVIEALSPAELRGLGSRAAVGHVRYSTTGGFMDEGAQPIVVGSGRGMVAVVFNGNIINYRELGRGMESPPSDTAVLAQLIARLICENHGDPVEALKGVAVHVVGSYSVALLTPEPRVVIARDPRGFKPLAYSFLGDTFAAASETSALESLGLGNWREVAPGEVVSFDGSSLEVARVRSRATPTPCIFEYVYFSRPDSFFNGVQVHEARVRMGMELARVAPVDADVVIPVPDSGRSAALGFSRASGVPMDEGLMRNRYVGRSFIMPPGLRELISSIKYGVVRRVVEGRRVVVVDDSLIRGTTMRSIVSLLRKFGAREVHVRIASPPVRYPCFMGIDFPTRRELIASKLGSVEEVTRAIGADSLAYNTLEGLLRAVGLPSLCTACFSGTYPFPNLNLEALEKSFARVVA